MAFDVGTVTNPATVLGVNSLTFAHNNNGDGLTVGISSWASGGSTVTGVTYAGSAMAAEGSAVDSGDDRASIYSKIAPASGSNNVVISMSGNSEITGGAISWTDSNQTDLCGAFNSATATSTTPSVAIVSAAGEIVMDVITWFTDPFSSTATEGAGQTSRWERVNSGETHGACSTEAGAASVTMSWTIGQSVPWISAGISVKPAAAGVTTRQYRLTTMGCS
jgi:hypothetical protein